MKFYKIKYADEAQKKQGIVYYRFFRMFGKRFICMIGGKHPMKQLIDERYIIDNIKKHGLE